MKIPNQFFMTNNFHINYDHNITDTSYNFKNVFEFYLKTLVFSLFSLIALAAIVLRCTLIDSFVHNSIYHDTFYVFCVSPDFIRH